MIGHSLRDAYGVLSRPALLGPGNWLLQQKHGQTFRGQVECYGFPRQVGLTRAEQQHSVSRCGRRSVLKGQGKVACRVSCVEGDENPLFFGFPQKNVR